MSTAQASQRPRKPKLSGPPWLARCRDLLESPTRRTQLVLTLACAAIALWTLVTMWIMEVKAYYALPWNDQWHQWRITMTSGYALRTFFALSNEHRVALPRLWFMMDHLWFGGTGVFIFVSINLIQFGHAMLLWRIGARAIGRAWTETLALGLLLVTILFSSQQFWNFTWSFQTPFVGVFLLATSSLYALMRAGEYGDVALHRRTHVWLAVSMVLAWGATYTMSNGLLLWPVVVLFALATKLPWRQVAMVAANGLLAAMTFLYGWHSPPQHLSPLESLRNPPQVLAFLFTYLGCPIDDTVGAIMKLFSMGGDNYRWFWCAGIGLVALVAGIVVMLRALEGRYVFNRAQLLLVHNLVFLTLTGLVTAIGRGIQFNLGDALASRYSTPPLIFWSCCLILLWSAWARRPESQGLRPGAGFQLAALMTVFLLVAIHQTPRLVPTRAFKAYEGEVEASMTAQVYDGELWKRTYYDPPALIPVIQYLSDHRLSVFRPDWTRWPGKKLSDLFQVARDGAGCQGVFDSAALVPPSRWPGIRAAGWAWDMAARRGPEKVILTNERNVIVGIATDILERPDVIRALPGISDSYVGWLGFVPAGDFTSLNAYLLRADGRTVCALGTLKTKVGFVHPSEIGEVLPASIAVVKGAWVKDGYYPQVGKAPQSGDVSGSWNGSDQNTGTISMTFSAPQGATAIALPAITGPNSKKASIQIVNRETGEVLDEFSPVPVVTEWIILKLSFPALAKNTELAIIASDDGSEWGQWLAIGQPYRLR